jgi:hypothetical protein
MRRITGIRSCSESSRRHGEVSVSRTPSPAVLLTVVFALGCPGTPLLSQDAGISRDAGPFAEHGPDAGASDAGGHDAGPSDAGPLDGGAPDAGAPDGDAGPCAALAASYEAALQANQGCTTSSDCFPIVSDCGLPAECGGATNEAGLSALTPIVDDWSNQNCSAGQECPGCAAPPGGASCIGGTCSPGAAGGQTCQTSSDCPRVGDPQYAAICLTTAPFTNGDCVQRCSNGWGCPAFDLSCQSVPTGPEEPGYCFLQCNSDQDCRMSDGYRCCPPWDAEGSGYNVCYPGPCPAPR